MMQRIEYSVVVPVPQVLAFRAFTDLRRLLGRGTYEEAVWVEGEPWHPGSRVRYVLHRPVEATISAVVTSCNPPRSVALLNHALGITAEQQVTFDPDPGGGTRVVMTIDFVGKSPELSEEAVQQVITFLAHDTLDTVAARCRDWARNPPSQ